MNKYLLLRDNKETGPYSLDQLIEKGLKKYDLVWLEGRSAAWRYPSEFDELKPYSPEVEEQPYDRFYKKPSATPIAEVKEVVQPKEEKQSAKTNETIPAKHIYVTMPGGNKATTVVTAKKEEPKKEEPKPVQEQPQQKKTAPVATASYLISEEDDELNSAMLKGHNSQKKVEDDTNNSFLNEYETRKAALQTKKTEPVKEEPKPEKKEKAKPVASTPKAESPVINYPRKKELKDLFTFHRTSGDFFKDNKTLTRSLLAACLILGGVVIGLIINSGKQQPPDAKVLETLVKEIREQQKDKSPASESNPGTNNKDGERQSDESATNDNLNNYTEQPSNGNNNLSTDPNARHAIIKKDNTNKENRSVAVPISNTSTEQEETPPAGNDNKDKINQETIEKARKNIYDLVGVEASQYKVGLLGGISDLDITISNNSLYALDQIAVEVKYFGPEKKLVKTQTLVFNHVPAGKQRTLEAPRTSRGITIDYAITGINSKALGIAQAGY